MNDAIQQTTQVQSEADFIDFGVGQPQLSLLPLQQMHQAMEAHIARKDPSLLCYGAEMGDGFLRARLAEFLGQGYGFPVDPVNLFITNGASLGLDLICTIFSRPGDTIFVEEPTYFLALRIFADHRLRPVAIPVDEHGLVIEALEQELAKTQPAFLYTIPTYQNPTGYTLSEERRRRLLALSEKHHFKIVADEVYHLLNYTSQPPMPFGGYAAEHINVLSLGSFSKILAPGLRLGWVQAHRSLLQELAHCGLLDSGGGLNPFTSALVREVIEQGALQKNIAELRSIYRERIVVMDRSLRKYLPQTAYQMPAGGYFFWLCLPDGVDAETLQKKAAAYKVDFRSGPKFSSRGELQSYARLCFAYYAPDEIEEGVRRLGEALSSLQAV